MKTSELSGAALDWAVAKCEEIEVQLIGGVLVDPLGLQFSPSIDWSYGGMIIEREEINLERIIDGWRATTDHTTKDFIAPTPLIAAMRCYVASKLGDEVELPEDLK